MVTVVPFVIFTGVPASPDTAVLRHTLVATALSTTLVPTGVQPAPGPVRDTVLPYDANRNRESPACVAAGTGTV